MSAPENRTYRIFLASPGDVAAERQIARDLLKDELPYDPLLRGRVNFDVVSWDDAESPTPMLATLSPQEAVIRFGPRPSECDVVVVILWSRLGTHLDVTKFSKADGAPYQSGTEWEFEDAISSKKPEVLVYRRTEEPVVRLTDPELPSRQLQLKALEEFLSCFKNADGSFKRGFNVYDTPQSFRSRLTTDLKHLLRQLMTGDVATPPLRQKASIVLREPPHDFEAEQALLGSIFSRNEAYHKVAEFLRPEHFADPLHGRLFSWLSRLIEYGHPTTVAALEPYLEQDKEWQLVGGTQYLVKLSSASGFAVDAEQKGRAIHDLYFRRQLMDLGEELISGAVAKDDGTTALDQIESAERKLYHLASIGRTMGGFKPFKAALVETVTAAEFGYRNLGQIAGVATGLPQLDQIVGGLQKANIIVLVGYASMGKSTLATNIALNAAAAYRESVGSDGQPAVAEGAVVGFFSLQASSEDVSVGILAKQTNIEIERIRKGELHSAEFDRVLDASRALEHLPLFLDDTPAISITALRTRARRLKRTKGLNLAVVDNLQLLRGSSPDESADDVISQLVSLARELDIPIVVVCELPDPVEERSGQPPELRSLLRIGVAPGKCDVVLLLNREEQHLNQRKPVRHENEPLARFREREEQWKERVDEVHGKVELVVASNKNGRTGTVELIFDPRIATFWSSPGSG